jgi:hypothetical protein
MQQQQGARIVKTGPGDAIDSFPMEEVRPANEPAQPLTRIVWVVGAWFVTQAALVVAAYLWVWLYSTFVDSGGDVAYYEAYARRASPLVAAILSGPVFYAMGRFMRRFGRAALGLAFAVVAVNLVLDVLLVATIAEDLRYNAALSGLAAVAKIGGAWIGARGIR